MGRGGGVAQVFGCLIRLTTLVRSGACDAVGRWVGREGGIGKEKDISPFKSLQNVKFEGQVAAAYCRPTSGSHLPLLQIVSHLQSSCLIRVLQAAVGGASGGGASQGTEGPLEELQGFDFARLAERRPELKQELLGFRDHLLASSSTEETLKVCPPPPP